MRTIGELSKIEKKDEPPWLKFEPKKEVKKSVKFPTLPRRDVELTDPTFKYSKSGKVHIDVHYPVLRELRILKASKGYRSYSAVIWDLISEEKKRRRKAREEFEEMEIE